MSTNPDNPLVSVITVVLNASGYIEKTMQSVFNQIYQPIEYVVIDGGSTDGTLEIIGKYLNRIKVLVSEPDSGIYNAINKGIVLTKGELVGIINAGDYYPPEAISNVVAFYKSSPGGDIYHGNVGLVSKLGDPRQTLYPDLNYRHLAERMTLNHPGSFVKKMAYEKYGLYNERFRIAGDYEFFARAYLGGAVFKYMDRTMAYMAEGGISDNLATESAQECHLIRTKNGISPYRSQFILTGDIILITLRGILRALKLYPVIGLLRRWKYQGRRLRSKTFRFGRGASPVC